MSNKSHQRPPFRAEHLGSLLRPEKLLVERHALDEGKGDQKRLDAVTSTAITKIVKEQLDLGFHAISDGEYPRHMFWGTFWPGLDGFEEITDFDFKELFRLYVPDIQAFTESGHKPGETVILIRFPETISWLLYVCKNSAHFALVHWQDQACWKHICHQWNFLRNLLPIERQHEAKLTLAAPNWYHLRYKTGKAYPKDVYSTDAEYFADVAKAYQTELQALYDNGLRNVQFDDPNLAYFCSEKMLAGFKEAGEDSEALFDSYIKLYNDCLAKLPADMHVGVHLCRGNFVGGRHFSEGGYDAIATKLFRDLNVDTYYLEYDTPRAGGFEPLKELPKNKNVILGLITSKFPELEDIEEMKKKVYQAAELIGKGTGETNEEALQRLGVSPQCGFASHSDGNNVGHDEMVAKLKLVRKLADEIWPGQP